MFPVDSTGHLIYQGKGTPVSTVPGKPMDELWLDLVEKAYAEWNETGKEIYYNGTYRDGQNSYASLNMGYTETVNAQVLNHPSLVYYFQTAAYKQNLINALQTNQAVTVISTNGGNGLYMSHWYAAISYDATTTRSSFTIRGGTTIPARSLGANSHHLISTSWWLTAWLCRLRRRCRRTRLLPPEKLQNA